MDDANSSPATLFSNELVTDVGGTCWGSTEPLAIIDHHFAAEGQFPSASAAVLHKANRIREKFTQLPGEVIWLVSHQEPDFDAFCSMYLARSIIESGTSGVDWGRYGLSPDAWVELTDTAKINWFNPDLRRIPREHRWPLLLASYASALDSRHQISCPPQRQLNSVLVAALKRGRDYANQSSGAGEFFDEVRRCLQPGELNPLFDSVLEGSTSLAPELAMLEHEAPAYARDLARARAAIVYLPEAEAPTARFFKTPKEVALLEIQGKSAAVNAEDLLLADTFRIPTSGLYLRDPECALFQEWARLDLQNAPLHAGFEFTAIASSGGRRGGTINPTDYLFSIDPERANGRHLYTLWSRLETKEVEVLRERPETSVTEAVSAQRSPQHNAALGALLSDPWFGGQSSFGTLVRTPSRGTRIGPPGSRSDLRDDAIGEEVRTELEGPIYSAESLVTGPQVTVVDLAGAKELADVAPRPLPLNAPLEIPPPQEGYFRFATVRLRADVPISAEEILGRQIGETLWQVLYPETPGQTPADFLGRRLVVTSSGVGVWGERGIAVAQKHVRTLQTPAPPDIAADLGRDFAQLASLVRDIAQLRSSVESPGTAAAQGADVAASRAGRETLAAQSEELLARAAGVQHTLTLPDRELLRRFAAAIDFDQLLTTLRDLNRAAAEDLRQQEAAEEAKLKGERDAANAAALQSRLGWLQVFVVGFVAAVIVDAMAWGLTLGSALQATLLLLAGPVAIGVTASILKPGKPQQKFSEGRSKTSGLVLGVLIAACVAAWLLGLLHIFSK